jgi:hypothetical protein
MFTDCGPKLASLCERSLALLYYLYGASRGHSLHNLHLRILTEFLRCSYKLHMKVVQADAVSCCRGVRIRNCGGWHSKSRVACGVGAKSVLSAGAQDEESPRNRRFWSFLRRTADMTCRRMHFCGYFSRLPPRRALGRSARRATLLEKCAKSLTPPLRYARSAHNKSHYPHQVDVC